MPTARAATVAAAISLLAVTGCASPKPTGGSAASTTVAGANSAGSESTPSAGAPADTSITRFAAGPVPRVMGATDLKKEPAVAPGRGTPPAKLTGRDLVVGTGAPASSGTTVTVQYVGALWSTGRVFDASWSDQGPASFPLSGVIAGFRDAIIGMKVGGRREIVIPPAMGYGASGQPPTIPPNATLVFVIDLLQIQP